MKTYNLKKLVGFNGAVVYNAYAALMMRLPQSQIAMELIKVEIKNGSITFGAAPHEMIQEMMNNLRELEDDDPLKKAVWFDVLKIVDNENPIWLDLLKLVEDDNGIQVTQKNANNFTAAELHEMIYQVFCECLSHSTEVFFYQPMR